LKRARSRAGAGPSGATSAMSGQLELTIPRATEDARGALSVTALVRMVRDALQRNLGEFWVAGEISNVRVPPSGHCYFTLKDAQSAIAVVMFASAGRRLRFKLESGMEVLVRGRVGVYEARGDLQVYAEELEPRGAGALQIAFEQLKRRLEAEGLFDPAHKRELPYLPRAVGVATARGGAGLRDILRILRDRFPRLHVIVRPTLVQGQSAAADIAAAIDDLNADGRAEVIIVGRGGGSLEDLWAFNEEIVARAIYRSRIPVVSAVGHEIDFTIADFVADRRAPTPSAAAQMVVPELAEIQNFLNDRRRKLAGAMARLIKSCRRELGHLRARFGDPLAPIRQARQSVDDAALELAAAFQRNVMAARARVAELRAGLRSPAPMVRERRLAAATAAARLNAAISSRIEQARGRFRAASGRLDGVSPLRVLERGYAVVKDAATGRTLTDAEQAAIGDDLEIRLFRGRLRARTTGREV
jgi:exodeoxyribonuclease VII large subunit